MRRHISYANVAATLALVMAMSGTAVAARHYLLNSTKQINPKVLRKLRGRRGSSGPIGPVGPQGIQGATGPKGVKGVEGEPGFSALSQLPSRKTESGELMVDAYVPAAGMSVGTAVTFPVPLFEAIPAAKVEFATVSTPGEHCLGKGTAPPGYLCVYTSSELHVEPGSGTSFNPEAAPAVGSGRFGVGFNWTSSAEGVVRITGTWAVTAP